MKFEEALKPITQRRGWQTLADRPNPAHCLFLGSPRATNDFYIFFLMIKEEHLRHMNVI